MEEAVEAVEGGPPSPPPPHHYSAVNATEDDATRLPPAQELPHAPPAEDPGQGVSASLRSARAPTTFALSIFCVMLFWITYHANLKPARPRRTIHGGSLLRPMVGELSPRVHYRPIPQRAVSMQEEEAVGVVVITPPTPAPTPEPTPPPTTTPAPTAAPTPDPNCQSLTTLTYSCLERAEQHQRGAPWSGGVVSITVNGDLANQIFDVVFGVLLADILHYQANIPGYLFEFTNTLPQNRPEVREDGCQEWTSVDQLNTDVCQDLVTAFERADHPGHCIHVHDGYWQRYSIYQPYKERIRSLLTMPKYDNQEFADPGPNDVVIHVRYVGHQGDPLQTWERLQEDPFYPQLTFEYYENILSRMASYDRVWVVCSNEVAGKHATDPGDYCTPVSNGVCGEQSSLVAKLREVYNVQVQSGDRFYDFAFLKRAKRLILAVSTFSWWAAFLSDATEIHYPLAGLFHPETATPSFEAIPPGELTVYDEERYIYHDLVNRRWWGKFNICKDDFEYQYEF